MAARRNSRADPLVGAAVSLLETLAQDDEYAEHVAAERIERLIADGELVRASSLQISGSLRIVSSTRIAALEAVVRHLASITDGEVDDDLIEAAIDALRGDHDEGDERPAKKKAPAKKAAKKKKKAPAKKKAAKKKAAAKKPEEPEPEPPIRRPRGMPEELVCEECELEEDGELLNEEQAVMSWTVFRKVLCSDCFVDYEKPAPPDDDDEDEP